MSIKNYFWIKWFIVLTRVRALRRLDQKSGESTPAESGSSSKRHSESELWTSSATLRQSLEPRANNSAATRLNVELLSR